MRRWLLGIGSVVASGGPAVVPASASAASPSVYQQVLGAYQSQGTVPACRFSGAELSNALNGVDTYGAQYFADFTQAVQAALSARAAGACTGSATPSERAPGEAQPAAHFGPVTAATSAGVPVPLAVLAGLALAAGLLGAGAVVVRSRVHR